MDTSKALARICNPFPQVEYSLTERGRSLMRALDMLCAWGEENRNQRGFSATAPSFTLKHQKREFHKKGEIP